MLSKLLKYEFKSTARIFIPLYVVLLVFSLVGRLSLSRMMDGAPINPSFIAFYDLLVGVVMVGYVLVIFSVIIIGLVVIVQRFYKNLTGREGYLMHTLPVPTHHLVLSKLLVAASWQLVGWVMMFLSVMLVVYQGETARSLQEFFREVGNPISFIFRQLGVNPAGFSLMMVLSIIVSSLASPLMIYAAIALGQLFKKHRIVGAVGAYIALSMITNTISSVLTTGFNLTGTNLSTTAEMGFFLNGIMILSLVLQILMGVGYFFLTNYILSNHLNLE